MVSLGSSAPAGQFNPQGGITRSAHVEGFPSDDKGAKTCRKSGRMAIHYCKCFLGHKGVGVRFCLQQAQTTIAHIIGVQK